MLQKVSHWHVFPEVAYIAHLAWPFIASKPVSFQPRALVLGVRENLRFAGHYLPAETAMEIKHDYTEEVRRAIPESIQIAQVRTSKT